jgi:GntR family transcriptional regulator
MDPKMPLYYRIESDLKNKIFSGHYKSGDILPSERELIDVYKVSRLTVRAAVDRLATENLVVKIQGKGTFVATPQLNRRMGPLYSGGEEILMRYYEVKTKVLNLKIIIADKIVKEYLELQEKEKANKTPVALIKSYLPYRYVPDVELIDFTDKSLYQILENSYNLQLHEAQETIEAVKAEARSANLLEIKPGTALLLNHRVTRLMDGKVIEYEMVEYRSDIYKHRNTLVGRGEARLAQENKSVKSD